MSLGKTAHVLSLKMTGILRAAIVSYINPSFLAKFRFPRIYLRRFYTVENIQINKVMYQSNRSLNIPPTRATPKAFEFLERFCSNSPLPRSKSCWNAPLYVHSRWSIPPLLGNLSVASIKSTLPPTPCYMQARHGLSTVGMPKNSTPSTWDVWGLCFASGSRTKYQTLKSSSVLSLRASTPFCCALSSGGQAMFNEWTTADSLKDCSMANLQQVSAHSAGQKSDTKTLWNLSSAVTFPTPHGKRVLMTVLHGAHLWPRKFWPSKQTASVRKIRFAKEERKGAQIPKPVQPPASPACIPTDTFARRLGLFSHFRTHSTSQWYEVMVFFASDGRTSSLCSGSCVCKHGLIDNTLTCQR